MKKTSVNWDLIANVGSTLFLLLHLFIASTTLFEVRKIRAMMPTGTVGAALKPAVAAPPAPPPPPAAAVAAPAPVVEIKPEYPNFVSDPKPDGTKAAPEITDSDVYIGPSSAKPKASAPAPAASSKPSPPKPSSSPKPSDSGSDKKGGLRSWLKDQVGSTDSKPKSTASSSSSKKSPVCRT